MKTEMFNFSGASLASTTSQTTGQLLAVGDSWFDYPLHDVLKLLVDDFGYDIESAAHRGDPIEAMASPVGQLDNLARCMDKIVALGASPKAILVSGGGDDIAGVEFGMLLNNATSSIAGWNTQIIDGLINTRIATAYRTMLLSINGLCQRDRGTVFPIIVHGYDYPVPDGRGFLGGWGPLPGPWLRPGFEEKLFDDLATNVEMMRLLIDSFNAMVSTLVKEPAFANVHYLDLRGSLSNQIVGDAYQGTWANELHPTKAGFSTITAKFATLLNTLP
jgi:hypothetical protein